MKGPREDAMLIYGVHKYGMGNWDQVRDDKSLGLDTKIANSDELDDGIKVKVLMSILFYFLFGLLTFYYSHQCCREEWRLW